MSCNNHSYFSQDTTCVCVCHIYLYVYVTAAYTCIYTPTNTYYVEMCVHVYEFTRNINPCKNSVNDLVIASVLPKKKKKKPKLKKLLETYIHWEIQNMKPGLLGFKNHVP